MQSSIRQCYFLRRSVFSAHNIKPKVTSRSQKLKNVGILGQNPVELFDIVNVKSDCGHSIIHYRVE